MERALRVIRILAVASFRRGLRGRLGLLALAGVLGMFMLGTVFSRFDKNLGLELRLVLETGLAASALLVLGTALLLSSRGFGHGEDTRFAQVLVALPVSRRALFLGHFGGLVLTLATYSAGTGLALAATVWWRFGIWRNELLVHFGTLFVEAVLLAAVVSLVARWGSAVVAFFTGLAVALIAHAEAVVAHLGESGTSAALDFLIRMVLKLLPDLAGLDVRASAVRGVAVKWAALAPALAHAALYLIAVLWIATALFERQEI